jgi:replicative DNA helicase
MGMKDKMMLPVDVPANHEAEQGAIGCVALGAYQDAIEAGVDAACWHNDNARAIWQACGRLDEQGQEINAVNLGNECDGVGMYLFDALEKAPTESNLRYWLPDLIDTAKRRGVFLRYYETMRRIADDDVTTASLIESMEQDFFAATTSHASKKNQKEAWRSLIELLEEAHPNGIKTVGLHTGMGPIDDIIRGFKPGSMNVVAGRPGGGKTAWALQVALNTAIAGQHVVLWSYEMPHAQLGTRLIANHSGEDMGHYLETGTGNLQSIIKAAQACASAPIHIEDRVDLNIAQLRSQARRFAKEMDTKLFVVDYLQLVPPAYRSKDRVREVGEISQHLKKAALETGVPFLVLAQMNRSIEERNGEPRLSDLRESGSIEQDSDTVSFLHMDENEPEFLQFLVKKNRHGRTGKVGLNWTKYNGRFRAVHEYTTTEEAPI